MQYPYFINLDALTQISYPIADVLWLHIVGDGLEAARRSAHEPSAMLLYYLENY